MNELAKELWVNLLYDGTYVQCTNELHIPNTNEYDPFGLLILTYCSHMGIDYHDSHFSAAMQWAGLNYDPYITFDDVGNQRTISECNDGYPVQSYDNPNEYDIVQLSFAEIAECIEVAL